MTGYRDPSVILEAIKAFRYRDASNAPQTAKAIRYRDASNTLQTLYGIGGLTATASPLLVSGWGYSSSPIRVTTDATAVTVTGGTGSFTYSWAFSSGLGWGVINPSSASTQFRSPLLGVGDDSSDTAVCTVTDTITGVTTTVPVNVSATNAF